LAKQAALARIWSQALNGASSNGSPRIANPPGRPLHILRVERSVDKLPSAGRNEV